MHVTTVGLVTLTEAKHYLASIGIEYTLPPLNAINYSNVPHQYNIAYQQETPVGILITTTQTNDVVHLSVDTEENYLEVGKTLLHATQVKQVLARTEDTELNTLLNYAGYRLTEDLVKFKLYRKSFLIQ